MLKQLARTIILALIAIPAAYAQQIASCDLVDSSVARTVLGSEITRHQPNRNIQKLDRGIAVSDCLFYARKDRDSLRVQLIEYPSLKEAEKAFAEATKSTDVVKHERIAGLGEEGTWWSIGGEAQGVHVRKGRRILVLDTRWRDGNTAPGLKERLTSAAAPAMGRL